MASNVNLPNKRLSLKRDESGAVLIIMAFLLTVLVGFAALALDIGYNMVVRNQLQNAADAAALAGADHLWSNNTTKIPDWSSAQQAASTNAPTNVADGKTVVDYEVQPGYWNLGNNPPGLQPETMAPGTYDASAVQVTVRKTAGKNGGPVNTFFAGVMGIHTVDQATTAIAVAGSPSTVNPGTIFPIAISRAVADQAAQYNSPANTIRIGSSYHYPNSEAGQWTSLLQDTNNVPTIRDLIANGNPDPIGVGTPIWIEPGTKTTIYNSVPVPADVVLPVVDTIINDATHSAVPVYSFIAFHITASVGGSGKYVEGYFLNNKQISGSPGGGPSYGVYAPSKLVK